MEYPRWIYPPDGSAGKLIASPDEAIDGWLDGPPDSYAAEGERVIGDGIRQPPRAHTSEVVAPPVAPAAKPNEKTSKKAK
jgi:hypothetical protein